jgi:hypothetical protein
MAKIDYVIQTAGNPLYNGHHKLGERYQVYGQISFVIDFLNLLERRDFDIWLVIIGAKNSFPEPALLSKKIKIAYIDSHQSVQIRAGSFIFLDLVDDDFLSNIPKKTAFAIVHYSRYVYSSKYKECCSKFICMSGIALQRQSEMISPTSLVMFNHGVDLQRFSWVKRALDTPEQKKKILISGRLEGNRGRTLINLISELSPSTRTDLDITVLGMGDIFWELADKYGNCLVLIPCINQSSMPHFIAQFDLIIGSGRIVMEALAIDRPVLVAGENYVGQITPENAKLLQFGNLTGTEQASRITSIYDDICSAIASKFSNRIIAEEYFNMELFTTGVEQLLQKNNDKLVKSSFKINVLMEEQMNKNQKIKDYFDVLKYEANLLSERMGWYITAQSFLFIAVVALGLGDSEKELFCGLTKFFSISFALAGIMTSIITLIFFNLGLKKSKEHRNKMFNLLKNAGTTEEEDAYASYATDPNITKRHQFNILYFSIPIMILLIWAVFLVCLLFTF